MTNIPSYRTSTGSARRKRASRLSLEALETRRVLTTVVEGLVAQDLGSDGRIDEGDPGQASVRVYEDANANGVLDIAGIFVEPDDLADGQAVNGVVPGVTFSVVDNSNQTLDLTVIAGRDETNEHGSLAPTGELTFGYDDVRFFNASFKLRVDLDTPASSVQLMFAGVREFATDFGLLEAYDSNDNLLDNYRTSGLIRNGSELMTVESSGDIAYVLAYTERVGLTGRFDSLRVDSAASERWTVTDDDGHYALDVGGAGTYRIRQVPPEGFEQILPAANAGRTVVVAEGETQSDITFANVPISAPTANDDTAQTPEDTVATINVLANDNGMQIDDTSVQLESQPANGVATVLADGQIEYTPNADYFGTDSLTYSVARDNGARSNAATLTIEVLPVNDPPVANDDTADATGAVTIDVLDNDTDVDSAIDVTSVQVESQPQNGSATVDANGDILYTPNLDFEGTDTFTYSVADEDGDTSNIATVTVTIGESGPAWQNPVDPFDVSDDGALFPFDVLQIINELNDPVWSDPVTGVLQPAPDPVPYYFDVNGDDRVTPLDVILVINQLNSQPVAARPADTFSVEAAAIADQPADHTAAPTTVNARMAAASVAANAEAEAKLKERRAKVDLLPQTVDSIFSV